MRPVVPDVCPWPVRFQRLQGDPVQRGSHSALAEAE
jgi:hypothetical protein